MALTPLRGRNVVIGNPFGNNAGNASDYLKKELKVALHEKQQESLINALQRPEDWLSERTRLVNLMLASLGNTYNTQVEKYLQYYPADEAVALATEDIRPIYEMEMRNIEIEHPGASILYQGALLDNNYFRGKASNFTKALNDNPQIEWKKAYKAKRKAKKAAKKGGQ